MREAQTDSLRDEMTSHKRARALATGWDILQSCLTLKARMKKRWKFCEERSRGGARW